MSEEIIHAASVLFDKLVDYYDESELQPPIQVGDALHKAIAEYRKASPGRRLPPKEGELMRRLLRMSRMEAIDKRGESQSAAEQWAQLLMLKHPILDTSNSGTELSITTGSEEQSSKGAEPRQARLTVNLKSRMLTLDGIDYNVASILALRWISALEGRAPEWVSSAELVDIDSELMNRRTDKLKRFLPPEVLELIESKPAIGSRIQLEAIIRP